MSSHADTAYLYTFTGTAFTSGYGSSFPSSPAIGDHLEIQFIFNGDLEANAAFAVANPGILNTVNVPFSMTCGSLKISSTDPYYASCPQTVFRITAVSSTTGLPTIWTIGTYAYDSKTGDTLPNSYAFSTENINFQSNPMDQIVYIPTLGGDSGLESFTSGTWTRTAVTPIPATLILFGSGLVGLVGIKRRKRS